MHFSLFISSNLSAAFTGNGFLVAIAVLACVLGAEIAGICILVSKMLRARSQKMKQHKKDEGEDISSIYRDYGISAVLLLGAIPQASYIALTVLAALAALAAVVFVVLLLIFRSNGYDFASSATLRDQMSESAPEEVKTPEEETVEVSEEDYWNGDGEEQRQEAYAEETDSAQEEEEPFAMFAEDSESIYDDLDAEEIDEEEIIEEEETMTDAESEDAVESEPSEGEPVEIVPVAPASQTTTVTTVCEEPALADGSQPYKVVEKTVTETVKEVYTETPAPQPTTSSTNDAVLEKLVDLLEYEIRGRHEQENKEKEARKEAEKEDSVPTFANDEEAPYDDDDEDEDDEDVSENGRSADDDDVDDEENDTEGEHFTGNERIIGFDETTGCYIVARYRKSFEAKLIQARPNIKQYYSDLKNALLSYKGTKSRVSWTADSFHNGREQIAKINVKTKILELYLAIDPASLEGTVYRGRDVGNKKKYADTPFQYKIRTPRKFKWAMELVQRVSEEHGLAPIDIEHVNYEEQYPFDSTENLVERKLIKEYIRQEKPATTFELDPDHVPVVPNEDESVIPANANFSWEFDNERMPEPEPEPEIEETPVAEPEPIEQTPAAEPEPVAAEPAPAPTSQATVTRETVKVTEVRYTERYYKDAEPTYEQVITTTEPIEAIAEPVAATDAQELPIVDADVVAEEVAKPTDAEERWNLPEIFDDMIAEDNTEDAEALEEERFFEDAAEETEETAEDDLEESEDALDWEENEETFQEEASEEDGETLEERAEEDYGEADVADDELFYAVPEEETYAEPEEEEIVETPIAKADKPAVNLNPSVAVVDICSLESLFPSGALINLETLKSHDLVISSATVLKIYASGTLSKAFTVEANHFTLDAIKAIGGADGDTVMVL
ncbi:MAG: uL15 family ribosomal protein [Clostridia bacterium]|nr:uL15 family ribosomal protein [Clostridia bacterium]